MQPLNAKVERKSREVLSQSESSEIESYFNLLWPDTGISLHDDTAHQHSMISTPVQHDQHTSTA